MSAEQDQFPTFLRMKQVAAITNLSRSSIYDFVARKGFPKPVRISEHRSVWVKSEIEGWIRARMNARKTEPPRGNPKRKKKDAAQSSGRPPRKVTG